MYIAACVQTENAIYPLVIPNFSVYKFIIA